MSPHTRGLRLWSIVGLVVFALFVIATGFVVVDDGKLLDLLVAVTASVVAPAVPSAVFALWRNRRRDTESSDEALAAAADALAREVGKRCEEWADERQLGFSDGVIPVRWEWSRRPVTGRTEDAVGAPHGVGRAQFRVLPGTDAVSVATLEAGGIPELFGVYAGLRSGRVVILGGPGAGKSAAAILTVLEALDHRKQLDEDVRAHVPVPVLLTPSGWEPDRQDFERWLADRLVSDFAALRTPKYGPETARQLIREQRIALFLDGFDEIAAEKRSAALRALKDQSRRVRLVLFSRSDEFTDAARTDHLRGAAALELWPVRTDVAADCLAAWQLAELPAPWQRLVDRLRAQPGSVLARALTTPLMLTLLRDAFRDPADVEAMDEFLSPSRFATPEDVGDYLLDLVLPHAYSGPRFRGTSTPYTLDQARRWLGHIATRMTSRETRDLAWWRMHEWAPAWWRILVAVAGGGLTAGLAAALIARFTSELGERTVIGIVPAAGAGAVLGLAIGLVSERRASRVVWPSGSGGAGLNVGMGLMSGLAVGSAVVLTVAPAYGPAMGVIVGMGASLTAGLATSMASDVRFRPPGAARRPEAGTLARFLTRSADGLPTGLATGVPAGLAAGIPVGVVHGAQRGMGNGLVIGLAYIAAFALIDGFSRASPDAASPVDPISAWRQDRRRSLSTGLVFGLAVGFAAGLTDALATVRHDPLGVAVAVGLITGLVIGIATGVGAGIAVSNSWRTMLLFLQLRARGALPLRAMRFLENAHQLQILRVVGPYYQFRHARLQDRLARPDHAPD